MKVEVKIILSPGTKPLIEQVEVGTTIERLVKEYDSRLLYWVLLAKMDNELIELSRTIDRACTIEFLDMRDPSGNAVYQRSVSFLYLTAISQVLGDCGVIIHNSLNKGLFTEIQLGRELTKVDAVCIESKMKELAEADVPFQKNVLPKAHVLKMLENHTMPVKEQMLRDADEMEKVAIYTCEGYSDFFYGLMVPSASYVQYFEVRKYQSGMLLRFPDQKVPNQMPEYRDDVKLYQAFGEAAKWGDLMGISFVRDLNEKVKNGSYREIIQISEALHEKKIAQLADTIVKQGKRIVLIAGPSSSGKTTFAKRLCIQLRVNGKQPLYLGTDDYFVERHQTPVDEFGNFNFEDLEALDIDLFNRDMNALLNGEEVDLPTFDFLSGKKVFGKRVTRATEGEPIVIEGIHGLNSKLTEEIPDEEKFKIYISPLTQLNIDDHNRIPTTDARLFRRIVRDHQFRNYSAQHTIDIWPKVRAGEDKNIFPFDGEADALFNSVHIYELAVLKKYAEPLLAAITKEEPQYSEAKRLLNILRYFKMIEDDSVIVNNSIIREFIGGSIFVD